MWQQGKALLDSSGIIGISSGRNRCPKVNCGLSVKTDTAFFNIFPL
jgi:hypothetical protein